MLKFDKPTLITITAPTCSGKSYLLKALVNRGHGRIVSTTTRTPRKYEEQGIDYDFITMERSLGIERLGEFAELIEFRGTRYGVTKSEMTEKMASDFSPVIILEPTGLAIYEQYCKAHNWDIFKVYVHTPEEERITRLNKRTYDELWLAQSAKVKEIIDTHTNRLLSMVGDERRWLRLSTWDAIVSGENVEQAIESIEQGIKWRNYRNSQLNT